MESRRSNKPVLPPSPGWWLAREADLGIYGPIEYIRALTQAEFELVLDAAKFAQSVGSPQEARPLYESYKAWQAVIGAGSSSLPRPPAYLHKLMVDGLVPFLLTWRMTLDHLSRSTSQQFGKESEQWKGLEAARRRAYDTYLVQHQERPPLAVHRTTHPYVCERCGKEHATYDVSVEIPAQWLLDSDKCPRILKQDLASRPGDLLDMKVLTAQAMEGIKDILYARLTTYDRAVEQITALVDAFRQAGPEPGLAVNTSVRTLSHLSWIIERAERPTEPRSTSR
jgi:hypothetical protein